MSENMFKDKIKECITIKEEIKELKDTFGCHFRADKDYDSKYKKQFGELKEFVYEKMELYEKALCEIGLNREVLRDHLKGLSPQLLLSKLGVGKMDCLLNKPKYLDAMRPDIWNELNELRDEKSFRVRCAKCGSEELTHKPKKPFIDVQEYYPSDPPETIEVLWKDLERIKTLVSLLNSYIDHHTNDYEGNSFYQELEKLIRGMLE